MTDGRVPHVAFVQGQTWKEVNGSLVFGIGEVGETTMNVNIYMEVIDRSLILPSGTMNIDDMEFLASNGVIILRLS